MEIVEMSTQDFVDQLQMGWIVYQEGDVRLRAKVIRGRGGNPFVSFPNVCRAGHIFDVVRYPDEIIWKDKARILLNSFKLYVGDDYYFGRTANPLPEPME